MKILLIEDNLDDRETMLRALGQICADAEVLSTQSEAETLRLLQDPSTPAFDLVFVDRHLPGALGSEVAVRLKRWEQFSTSKFIMLTSDLGDAARTDALVANIDSFLEKPADLNKLANMVLSNNVYWQISDLPRNLSEYRTELHCA